jgi:signal transduction histidine kinase
MLVLIAFFACYASAIGQQSQIDSLERVIQERSGIDQYDPLIELFKVYATGDYTQAFKTADRAFAVASQFSDTARMVRARRIKGQLFNRIDLPKEAIEILTPSLAIAKRNNLRNEIKTILNNLALAYTIQAKYEKALAINFETLKLREVDGDKAEISISYNNIGYVYFKLKNYKTSLEFFNRALDLKRAAKDTYDLDRLLINIGLCHNQLGNFPEAQRFFSEAFKVCGDNCHNQIIVEGEFGLGVSYYNMNDYVKAKSHFRKSLIIAEETLYKRFEAENLIYFAHIYVKESQLDSALVVLNRCEEIAHKAGYTELLISTYKEFAALFTKNKNYEKASYYQNQYITLKDTIINGEVIDKLAKIQTDYAERENKKIIADKEDQIQRQRSLGFAIVVIAILAALLIFVLYRSNRVKKRVNQALSDAKAIIEDQNRQLMSSNYNLDKELKEKNIELEKANESLLRVNEELDNFIYKTSHDIRGPLASLKGMCNVALMDVKDQLALNYLKKLDITAEKLNTILTRLLIVNQINNSALGSEKIDFDGIVGDVLMLEKKKGLPPRLKIKKHIDDAIEFYSDKEFVRIILENLIDNAIKFYNDSERIEPFVDISVTEEADYIKIKVVDNGIGISEVHPDKIFQMFSRASERSETGGIGLYITKTATEKLGGSVHLKTTPEGYTEFFVTLPFSSSKVLA